MRFLLKIVLFVCFAVSSFASAKDKLTEAGDLLQIALPFTAFGASFFNDFDKSKDELYYLDFAKSFSTGWLLVHGMKLSMEKVRPDGSNNKSFPSAHTFAAFSGASYIHSRFGSAYGVPAYLLAAGVGFSRIEAESHYLDDVLAGASIATLLNVYFSGRKNPETSFYIGSAGDNYSLNVSAKFDEDQELRNFKSKYRFSLYMGPTTLRESEFSFNDNDLIDLFKLKREESYQHTTNLFFEIDFKKYGFLSFGLQPFELNIQDDLYKEVKLLNKTFAQGENVFINWLQYDFDTNYLISVFKNNSTDFFIGAGLYFHYSNFEVISNDVIGKLFKSRKGDFVPYLSFALRNKLYNRLSSTFSGSFFSDGVTQYYKGRLSLDYQLQESWTVSAVSQLFFRQIEMFEKNSVGDTFNESKYSLVNLGVKYSF